MGFAWQGSWTLEEAEGGGAGFGRAGGKLEAARISGMPEQRWFGVGNKFGDERRMVSR